MHNHRARRAGILAHCDGSSARRFIRGMVAAGVMIAAGSAAAASPLGIRMELRYPGVYEVTVADLTAAGLPPETDPAALAITNGGRPVPILVTGADDGALDPRDTIQFVGHAPRTDLLTAVDTLSTATWLLPNNKSNVYFLTWNGQATAHQYQPIPAPADLAAAADFIPQPASEPPAAAGDSAASDPATALTSASLATHFWQHRHLERNYIHWLTTLSPDLTDNFFWNSWRADMPPGDGLRTALQFPEFDAAPGQPVRLDIQVFGQTNATGLKPSHLFDVLYGDQSIGQVSFDGIALHQATAEIPADQVKAAPTNIAFGAPDHRTTAVDSILLDWIKITYPSRFDAAGAATYTFNNNLLTTPSAASGATTAASARALSIIGLAPGATIYDPITLTAWQLASDQTRAVIPNTDHPTTYTASAPHARLSVDSIQPATVLPRELYAAADSEALPRIPSDLQAVVIYHPRLARTADAYTTYRREQGWHIQAVSVTDVFDHLNHGFIHDATLKDYLASVRRDAPGLSHIILLGDAFFDYREARNYDSPDQYDILIPIHWVYRPGVTWSGGYQDDNWYGSFTNEHRPDVAVGRLPVNDDAQGMEYLRKIIEHETFRATATDKGLLISSVEQNFQSAVSEIGNAYGDRLTTISYLFPRAATATREVTALSREINQGVQLMYYIGHGGSMVWRVGPTDFARQKDLFTPADVASLSNRGHYPVIVCASCYTTAFDQAESIGEALVNQPAGGAIAVIGAPWKATVQESHSFNQNFFRYYFDPGISTIGQASLAAHRDHIPVGQAHAMYNSFTLLGDPAAQIIRYGDVATTDVESTLFKVEGDRIVFRDYDDAAAEDTQPRARLTIKDFPDARVYRERILLAHDEPIISKAFAIPADATSITITARSRPGGDEFPRLRFTIITQDNNHHRLHEGYWDTLNMESRNLPLTEYMVGQKAQLKVEILNPGTVEEERTWYFMEASID